MLSPWTIAAWAVLIVLIGVVVAVWLLLAYTGGNTDANRVQLDAIRTAGTIVVGTGGAAALLLAARRQRTAEIALKQKDRDQADVARAHALQERVAAETRAHQERVAAATEHDAAERRVTELYTKAADQLGSDKAPVRLAGLYALERLAQNNPDQRQTIVNVLCAYLRMPFAHPIEMQLGADEFMLVDQDMAAENTKRIQELEVRLAAQRILAHHLRPGDDADKPAKTFWADIDLDLTSATLIEFNLARCTLRTATFNAATFTGVTDFGTVTFTGPTYFVSASFTGPANFESTFFTDRAYFGSATFDSPADFGSTTFNGPADFRRATFTDQAHLRSSTFTNRASFAEATFACGVPKEVKRFWSPPPNDAPGDGDAAE